MKRVKNSLANNHNKIEEISYFCNLSGTFIFFDLISKKYY